MEKKLLKNGLLMQVAAIFTVAATAPAISAPMFAGGINNTLTVTAVQNLVDNGAPGLSAQDLFYGILSVDNIHAGGTEIWDARNVAGMPVDSFSGYYVAEVKSVFTAFPTSSPFAAAVTLGAAPADPNGKFSAAELAAGTAFKLYIDSGATATPFETNGSVLDDIAKATDGIFWGSLGFSGGNEYWSALVLKNGQIQGRGGIDFIANATGMPFNPITDPGCSTCLPTDVYFSTVARDNGPNALWRFGGSNSANLRPSQVPEPGTLSLLALGGLWFFARRSKRG